MNMSRMWLAVAAATWLTLPGRAAPVPIPASTSGSPIGDAVRLAGMLPRTAPLLVRPASVGKEGFIELERPILETRVVNRTVTLAVPEVREAIVKVQLPGGKVAEERRRVTAMVYVQRVERQTVTVLSGKFEKMPIPIKDCKFFVVSKDGKLEAIDADKATTLLKKRTAVLTGDNPEVDPRTLELVKPGTLCVIHQPRAPVPPPPPLDQKPPN